MQYPKCHNDVQTMSVASGKNEMGICELSDAAVEFVIVDD